MRIPPLRGVLAQLLIRASNPPEKVDLFLVEQMADQNVSVLLELGYLIVGYLISRHPRLHFFRSSITWQLVRQQLNSHIVGQEESPLGEPQPVISILEQTSRRQPLNRFREPLCRIDSEALR